jgi:competence protein ComEA
MIKTSLLILAISLSFCIGCSTPVRDRSVRRANSSNSENLLNINTATPEQLRELPGIGDTLADRIVRYRDANGRFRRVEHLMLVDGISENKFRGIRPFVRTE